jgi:hypothetical protein
LVSLSIFRRENKPLCFHKMNNDLATFYVLLVLIRCIVFGTRLVASLQATTSITHQEVIR